MNSLKLGTRESELALAQTNILRNALIKIHPHLKVEIVIIRTQGDIQLNVPLGPSSSLDKGVFTKELEMALLRGEIHAAVHSLKDLPTEDTAGLCLVAILPRAATHDVLITKYPGGLHALLPRAKVGTSSPRRRAQILNLRPDLCVQELRGNVPTRIRKLAEAEDLSAIVLAAAGLERLQLLTPHGLCKRLKLHTEILEDFLPAPGQGAIAIQAVEADSKTCNLLASVHDRITAECVHTERLLLKKLGGGCHLALGALAKKIPGGIHLRAIWWRDALCLPLSEASLVAATPEEAVEAVAAVLVASKE